MQSKLCPLQHSRGRGSARRGVDTREKDIQSPLKPWDVKALLRGVTMVSDKLYQDNILEHYREPHHRGSLVRANATGQVTNPLCGDEMQVKLRIEDGKIMEVAFTGQGCAISTAAASMLLDTLPGKTVVDIEKLCSRDVLDLLGIEISPTRMKCALLVLDSVRKAFDNYAKPYESSLHKRLAHPSKIQKK